MYDMLGTTGDMPFIGGSREGREEEVEEVRES